jgi:hypothetical protein
MPNTVEAGNASLEHGQQFIFEEPLRVPLHHSRDQFDEVHSHRCVARTCTPSALPHHDLSPKQISIRDLLRKFKAKGVVYLYMAVLMGYRVLVMGHNVSTSQICQYVFHFLPRFACLHHAWL